MTYITEQAAKTSAKLLEILGKLYLNPLGLTYLDTLMLAPMVILQWGCSSCRKSSSSFQLVGESEK